MTEKEKVLARLNKYKSVEGNCWRWLGALAKGRPHLCIDGVNIKVARLIMWITQDFDFKSKLHVLHKTKDGTCKFIDCWNPEHLYIGTHAQNMQDKVSTHCRNGHEFTVRNTIYEATNRKCRRCSNERRREWYRRNKLRAV